MSSPEASRDSWPPRTALSKEISHEGHQGYSFPKLNIAHMAPLIPLGGAALAAGLVGYSPSHLSG